MASRENIHYSKGSFFIKALTNLVGPDGFFLVGDDKYENVVEWHVANPPTPEQVSAERDRLKAEWDNQFYAREREFDYPDWKELADAIYWKEKGDDSKMKAYIDKIDEIKAKYPKDYTGNQD